MAEISIPAGAFAAMKSGTPTPPAPSKEVKNDAVPLSDKKIEDVAPPPDLTPAQKKIWRLKADGEEFDFDASDEDNIKRLIEKSRGADKRFDTAASLKKQAEQFFEMLKDKKHADKFRKDPALGKHFMELAKEAVWQEIQEQQMSPEERLQHEKNVRLAELEYKDTQDRERESTEREQRETAHYEQHYEQVILKALEVGNLPIDTVTVNKMADLLATAMERNYDLTPEELVHEVRKDLVSGYGSLLKNATGEQIIAFLGEENAKKLREYDLKRLRNTQSNPYADTPRKKQGEPKSQQPKKLVASDWVKDVSSGFSDFLKSQK